MNRLFSMNPRYLPYGVFNRDSSEQFRTVQNSSEQFRTFALWGVQSG
jgi:hypothetical protein